MIFEKRISSLLILYSCLFMKIVFCKHIIRNPLFKQIISETIYVDKFSENHCIQDLQFTLEHITEEWAFKMWDASSKISSGLIFGNIINLGSFDECVSIYYRNQHKQIKGNYCKFSAQISTLISALHTVIHENKNTSFSDILKIDTDLSNISFIFSICVPNSCTANILNKLVQNNFIKNIHVLNCQTNDSEEFSVNDYMTILFFAFITIIIILSTIYDLYFFKNTNKGTILISFSLYSNAKKLFQINNKSNQLLCLHGIKVLSMMWIILAHTSYTLLLSPNVNGLHLLQWFEEISSMYVLGAPVAVDTFFTIGGLLITYVYLLVTDTGVKFNIFIFYFHRYLS